MTKSPLFDYKHWITWFLIAGVISLVAYFMGAYKASIWIFISWFVSIMVIDLLMHKAGWQ